MNFNHLFIFYKVAEKRHFTRAAEELLISQPAVSKQVHELERTLGQALLTQIGRKIYLTEAGQTLYEYANRIFALSVEAEEVLDEMRQLERGRLAIGASTTIGIYLLPERLGRYRQLYPHVDLFLDIANADEVQERLVAHRVEIGLIEGEVTYAELAGHIWRQDELVLIAAPDHFLASRKVVSLQDLLVHAVHFLVREQGSGTRSVFEEAIAMRGLQPIVPFMELGSTEAIKKAVAANLGVAFVSEQTIKLELAAGLLKQIPIVDFKLMRPLYLVYPRQKRLSKAVQAFVQLLE